MGKLFEDLRSKLLEIDNLPEETKQSVLKSILEMQQTKANVLITGATGCGKSSTINALFKTEKAKVGTSPNPETMEITKYELGPLTLWDSPGLGDGAEADKRHAAGIRKLLTDKDENGNLLIDVILVILDGSSRDLGTSYELIRAVIAPCLNESDKKRLIIGINQADMAMKGKHWDSEKNKPDNVLMDFLKEKEQSVHDRILEATNLSIQPVSYSAGFKEEDMPQENPYNLSKLLYYIMDSIPSEKRLNVVEQINEAQEMWSSDDEIENYRQKINESAQEGIIRKIKGVGAGIAAGAAAGAALGSVIPVVGTVVGTAVGAVLGGLSSLIGSFLD